MRLAARGARGSLGRLVVLPSVLLYGVSFVLPTIGGPSQPTLAYAAFAMALFYPLWFAVAAFPAGLMFTAIYFPCWLANVAYWVALRKLGAGEDRGAARSAVLAVILALTIVWVGLMGRDGLGVGYSCWVGSMVMLAFGTVTDARGVSRPTKPENGDRGWDD